MKMLSKKVLSLICFGLFIIVAAVMVSYYLSYAKTANSDLVKLRIFKLIVELLASFAVFGFAVVIINFRFTLEKIVPVAAFVFGLFYLVCITPLSVPDEEVHYRASFQLSNYILLKEEKTMLETAYFDYNGLSDIENSAEAYLRIIDDFNGKLEESEVVQIDKLPNIWSLYYFLEYIP